MDSRKEMTSDEVAVVRGFQMALDWRRNSARPFQAWVALNTRAKVEGIEPSRNQRRRQLSLA